MSILSMDFLCFAGLTLAVYYILPRSVRAWSLLAFSAVFVILNGWQGGAHLLAVSVVSYVGALGLQKLRRAEKAQGKETDAKKYVRFRRLVLFLLLTLDLGAMLFLKFYPKLAAWLNGGWLRASPLPIWDLIVPLGLSYFTFQSMGYLIDVYRGKAEAAKNPFKTLLFTGYFLYLPQGPISTWRELEGPLTRGNLADPVLLVSGFQLTVWGYFKKLVVADRLALITAAVLGARPKMPGWMAMGGTIVYAVRLYADFSGGVDVVRGISRMLGVELPETFRRPFVATSVADYWRRWHITLGAWFRSYVLYPLATTRFSVALGKAAGKVLGKKAGRMLPTALGAVLVFLLVGLWHGADWNPLIYGGYFGLIVALSMLLEPLWKWLGKKLRLPQGGWMTALRMVRTWLLILPPQFFAYTATPDKALRIMERAFDFTCWDFSTFTTRCLIIMPALEWWILGGAFLLMLAVDILSERKKDLSGRLARKPLYVRWPLIILLIVIVLIFGCYGTDFEAADFVYTQF